MELRFIPAAYSEALTGYGLEAIPEFHLNELLAELRDSAEELSLEEVNYGPGADWIWIYAVLVGITNLVALGGTINSGIEGWASLARKIRAFRSRCSHIALDSEAVSALCIGEIIDRWNSVSEIQFVISHDVDRPSGIGIQTKEPVSAFLQKGEVYYIRGYQVNRSGFVLFGCTSSGHLETLKEFRE
ncbi:hypothetical protein [Halofilum ochraceum]|uniref:hypothetical protein n=1 Tax=Halofilum ochraceum TaxID=1611323 RepID=UPI00082E2DC6|nr:hypothetical protein [Halofilum ochraceum]